MRVVLGSLEGSHLKLSLGPGPWIKAMWGSQGAGSQAMLQGTGKPDFYVLGCKEIGSTDTCTWMGPRKLQSPSLFLLEILVPVGRGIALDLEVSAKCLKGKILRLSP